MRILGVSAFYHDSAAALIEDGYILAAAQEERFTRKKHDAAFPKQAITYCLEEAGFTLDQIDYVAFYDKPFLKFERLIETYLAFAPRGFQSFKMAMPVWLKEKLFQKDLLRKQFKEFDPDFDWQNKLLFSEHHMSHAASAFFPSPFEEAVVLTMDGVGEWATTSVAIGKSNTLEMTKEIHFPHSLGLLYSALTYYTGFRVNSGEYKVMGLAPYGEPKYKQLMLDHLIDVKDDGSFRLNQKYFDYCTGLTMTNANFDELFGAPRRKPEELLTQRHMDLAARPFAPSVLCEDVSDWFDIDSDSPYMLVVSDVKEDHRRQMTDEENALFGIDKLNVQRSDIPAVTHVDYSARIQTVHAETHPQYHALITKFKELTGCPIVVNTSFNVRGEPIVCTPEDAFRCFMGTDTELLVIGNVILHKDKQDPALKQDYTQAFELD